VGVTAGANPDQIDCLGMDRVPLHTKGLAPEINIERLCHRKIIASQGGGEVHVETDMP
jgi:hypothetical protein